MALPSCCSTSTSRVWGCGRHDVSACMAPPERALGTLGFSQQCRTAAGRLSRMPDGSRHGRLQADIECQAISVHTHTPITMRSSHSMPLSPPHHTPQIHLAPCARAGAAAPRHLPSLGSLVSPSSPVCLCAGQASVVIGKGVGARANLAVICSRGAAPSARWTRSATLHPNACPPLIAHQASRHERYDQQNLFSAFTVSFKL